MDKIQEIINTYEKSILEMEQKGLRGIEGRAYGGIVRAGKGELVESIANNIVGLAWEKLGGPDYRLKISKKSLKVPIKRDYIEKLKNPEIKNYIKTNINKYVYPLTIDWLVLVDDKPVIAIECKAYTENAMLKRILVDFTLFKEMHPNVVFMLFQLESQLGGDYYSLNKLSFGSPSSHTLLSYFDIDLHIVTLLKGERKVDRPIHKKEFFKPLTKEGLENAIAATSGFLEKYV